MATDTTTPANTNANGFNMPSEAQAALAAYKKEVASQAKSARKLAWIGIGAAGAALAVGAVGVGIGGLALKRANAANATE